MILLFFAALPKKDKIDPWRLAVSGPFTLIIKNDTGSL
jgi:hypothetical protein